MYFDDLTRILDASNRPFVTKISPTTGFMLTNLGRIAALSVVLAASSAIAQTGYLLSANPVAGNAQKVKVIVEIQGDLKTNPDGKKVTRLPMSVSATLNYEEQVLSVTGDKRRAARFYEEAQADLRIKDHQQKSRLNEARRLIVVQNSRDESEFLSAQGPLTRDELDLLDVPGSSLVGPDLLPGREVRIGDTWTPAEPALALLLGLEAVSKSDVAATFTKVDGDVAIIDLGGVVQGAVGGVATEIELKGKLNFSLAERRLTWLALALKENRSIGHAEPGFETVARIRVALQPLASPERLTKDALAGLPAANDTGAALLQFESAKGGYKVLHDRRWRAMVDRSDVSILRMVDRGDLIAQCNLSPLPDGPPGKHLAMAEFKAEIQEALGKNFGQIVEATNSKTDSGLTVLRVVATGQSQELPIQWIYYHVSNDQGRRAAYVFTLEARLADRFGAADDLLTSSFEFVARPGPTPALGPSGVPAAASRPAARGPAIPAGSSGEPTKR